MREKHLWKDSLQREKGPVRKLKRQRLQRKKSSIEQKILGVLPLIQISSGQMIPTLQDHSAEHAATGNEAFKMPSPLKRPSALH